VTDGASTELDDAALVARFPGVQLTHDNKVHYRARLDHRLLVNRCADCGTWHEPPAPVCPSCWSRHVIATPVSGRGTIHLAIFLYQGPPAEGVDYTTPWPVVTVALDDAPGVRVTGTVIGAPNDDIAVGRAVELDWIDRAGTPVLAFRLATDRR